MSVLDRLQGFLLKKYSKVEVSEQYFAAAEPYFGHLYMGCKANTVFSETVHHLMQTKKKHLQLSSSWTLLTHRRSMSLLVNSEQVGT